MFGLQVHAGCEVMERDILAIQRRLDYHPGLNVGIDPRDLSLYSACDGTLLVTTEKFKPNKDHELVQKYYGDLKGNLFKKYVHVIPKQNELNFKLVDIV
ncbi:50S ribosomal protein L27-like protein [Leptotrombidium deliense]|uniref:50S ribosomal protein L27-like protein n=1 Tax=Leptotrombidium deliense TaxID=299467 RepID=A0A443SP82_9ACAR|nr:50S ribosomal protein L27-like protein [Leptotrombidium deliense]